MTTLKRSLAILLVTQIVFIPVFGLSGASFLLVRALEDAYLALLFQLVTVGLGIAGTLTFFVQALLVSWLVLCRLEQDVQTPACPNANSAPSSAPFPSTRASG